MQDQELDALIKLIDDPDETVYDHIRDQLIARGESVIPELENAWEKDPLGVDFRTRIEEIIHKIQFNEVKDQLANWTHEGGRDLLEGALIVSRYQYPDMDEQNVVRQIDQIKQDVWLELNNRLTGLEKVKVIDHILFEVHGFAGNKTNFHAPHNNFINHVLESKKGNPLSLSLLYIIVAQSAGVPVFGVNLPNHFILAYLDENNILGRIGGKEGEGQKVLFYINPFNKGGIFNKKEIDNFLSQMKLEKKDKYYEPCTNRIIIKRAFNNLFQAYKRSGYEEKAKEIEELLEVMKTETEE